MENIKSKDRSTIRKAVKNGITVDLSDKPELFEEFVDIYNATMTKDHADKYYFFGKKFYKSIINDLQGKWLLATARLENKVIAMSIILLCNGRMHYHLSGSVLEYRRLNATNLILYETAKYGAEHGYTIFHLGGGVGSGEDSLYNFKKSFNKHGVLQFSISKDIFDKEKYENLVALRIGKDNDFHKSSFFPEYRSICD